MNFRLPSLTANPRLASEWEDNACCSIWRVRLEDSERFSVSHLSLFPLVYPGDFGNDSFVMNRDVLLRGTDEPHTRVFEVFDYRNCSNHQLRRGLVVLPREGSLPHVSYCLHCLVSCNERGRFLGTRDSYRVLCPVSRCDRRGPTAFQDPRTFRCPIDIFTFVEWFRVSPVDI